MGSTSGIWRLVGALVLLCAFDENAMAQTIDARDVEARELFAEAAEVFDTGGFERALTLFQRAYELSPRPQLLFNIGTTEGRLGYNEAALQSFERYLAAIPDAPNRSSVLARMDLLREEIERDRAIAESLESASTTSRRRRRWLGGVAGAVALVVGAIIIGVAAGKSSRPYEQGAFGVQFTLSETHP